jgi:hypothetical protein
MIDFQAFLFIKFHSYQLIKNENEKQNEVLQPSLIDNNSLTLLKEVSTTPALLRSKVLRSTQ